MFQLKLRSKRTRFLQRQYLIHIVEHFDAHLKIIVDVILADGVQFVGREHQVSRNARVPSVEGDFHAKEAAVLLDEFAVTIP